MVEHLDEPAVDKNTRRDGIEDTDAEQCGARVGVVTRMNTHTDGDSDGGDELGGGRTGQYGGEDGKRSGKGETHPESSGHGPLLPTLTRWPDQHTDTTAECEALEHLVEDDGWKRRRVQL